MFFHYRNNMAFSEFFIILSILSLSHGAISKFFLQVLMLWSVGMILPQFIYVSNTTVSKKRNATNGSWCIFSDLRIILNLDFWYRSQLVNKECVWLLERNKVTIGPQPCICCLLCLSCQEYCVLLFSPIVVSGDYPVPGKNFAMHFITLAPTWQDSARSKERRPLAWRQWVWKFPKMQHIFGLTAKKFCIFRII